MAANSRFEIEFEMDSDADSMPVLRIEKISSTRIGNPPFDHPAFLSLRPQADQPCLTITEEGYFNLVEESIWKIDPLVPSTFDTDISKAIILIWSILYKYVENQFQSDDLYFTVTLENVTIGHEGEIEIGYFVPPELLHLTAESNFEFAFEPDLDDEDPIPAMLIEKINSTRTDVPPFNHPAFLYLRPQADQPCLTITEQDYFNLVEESIWKVDPLVPTTFGPDTSKAIMLVWSILHKHIENRFQSDDHYSTVTLDRVTIGHEGEIEIGYLVPPELFHLLPKRKGPAALLRQSIAI